MDLAMYIVKPNKFNMIKKEAEEFKQQSKNLEGEKRRLEHSVEIIQSPIDD